jgi:hypothetical protein
MGNEENRRWVTDHAETEWSRLPSWLPLALIIVTFALAAAGVLVFTDRAITPKKGGA